MATLAGKKKRIRRAQTSQYVLYGLALFGGLCTLIAAPTTWYLRGTKSFLNFGAMDDLDAYTISTYNWQDLARINDQFRITDMVPMASGILASILSCVGIYATAKDNRKALYLVSAGLTVAILMQMGASAAMAMKVYTEYQNVPMSMRNDLRQHFLQSMDQYQRDDWITQTWDTMQQLLCCCGVDGPSDWHYKDNAQLMPESCSCHPEPEEMEYGSSRFVVYSYSCRARGSYYYWTRNGCENPVHIQQNNVTVSSIGCLPVILDRTGRNLLTVGTVTWSMILGLCLLLACGAFAPAVGSCCRTCCTSHSLGPSDMQLKINSSESDDEPLLTPGDKDSNGMEIRA